MKLLVLLLVALPVLAQTPGVEPKQSGVFITEAEQEMIMGMINQLGESNKRLSHRLTNCLSRFEI